MNSANAAGSVPAASGMYAMPVSALSGFARPAPNRSIQTEVLAPTVVCPPKLWIVPSAYGVCAQEVSRSGFS